MLVFDFFSGTGSSTQAFRDAGHTVVSFELDDFFVATENVDVLDLSVEYLLSEYGRPDFVWASPPCTAFSVASVSHHWVSGGDFPVARSEAAVFNQLLVAHVRGLAEGLAPRFGFLLENPRGMLRKLEVVAGLDRTTVTYCQYGDSRMKPTDLFGSVLGWSARPACRNGDSCHVAAPRGSSTGTQGLVGSRLRSMVPYDLGVELLAAMEGRLVSDGLY